MERGLLCLRLPIFFVLFGSQAALHAQTSIPLTQPQGQAVASTRTNPLSGTPTAILDLAALENGLDFGPLVPWHVKLTYDQFDEDGDNIHSGTFEEFYAGSKKYKQVLVGDVLNQVNVATEAGLYRSGDQTWIGPVELQVQTEILSPLHRASLDPDHVRPEPIDWPIGKATLPCVVLRRTDMTISPNGLTKFCFDPAAVRLRYTRGKGWDETVYNNLITFQGRTVAKDATVTRSGKPYLKIHLVILETLEHVDDSVFAAQPGSSLIGGRIILSGAILDEYLIKRGGLSGGGEKGEVHLRFVVGKDGQIIEAEVIDGPERLRKTALKSMREFRFRPFLVLDQPVEVESKMVFDYQ